MGFIIKHFRDIFKIKASYHKVYVCLCMYELECMYLCMYECIMYVIVCICLQVCIYRLNI